MISNRLQKLCGELTHHKLRKLEGWTENNYKPEYYWRCKICGMPFWNYNKEMAKPYMEKWKKK